MDVISFAEASTANSRIEKVNANPDSNSGIVTVPSVIATGDSVTIPAGRTAVLPNVQVDGELVVDGEVFVPSGTTFGDLEDQIATKVNTASPTFTGNITLSGTGNRIRGDFSNATPSNRLAFQSSTTNGNTGIPIIPNGTATASNIQTFNSSDINNASQGYLSTSATAVELVSNKIGTGTYLPMAFVTSGSEAMRIDTNRNVLVTGAGGLGYGNGSGGTVTQLTSKGTAVTLNKPTGQIIMHNSALGAGASVVFGVINSLFTINDTVVLLTDTVSYGASNYRVEPCYSLNGHFGIRVTNIYSVSLSEPISIHFTIIKGANS